MYFAFDGEVPMLYDYEQQKTRKRGEMGDCDEKNKVETEDERQTGHNGEKCKVRRGKGR